MRNGSGILSVMIKTTELAKGLPWLLIIGGVIGILCSVILVHDQVAIWKNPNFVPACSLNPVVNCGTVIDSKQGEVFGIPAPFFGLLVFPALVTIGTAILAGAKLKRWFWQWLGAGAVGGVAFALWLFWLSMYKVHALCPFCLMVDVVVYAIAWYVTLYNLEHGYLILPKRLDRVARFARKHHLDILIAWLLLLVVLILNHFWYYYGQYF